MSRTLRENGSKEPENRAENSAQYAEKNGNLNARHVPGVILFYF